jgi:hypothetical protein
MASLQVSFSAEELAELHKLAALEGIATEELVRGVALRALQEEAELTKILDESRNQLERGEGLTGDEVWARIEARASK